MSVTDSQHPRFVELANYHERGKTQRCKVISAGWYGVKGQPVKLGEEIELQLHEAQTQRALERVEFV